MRRSLKEFSTKRIRLSNSRFFTYSTLDKFYQVTPSEELSETIETIDRIKGEIIIKHTEANGDLRVDVQNKLIALLIYNSMAIEDSPLSLGDTISYIQGDLQRAVYNKLDALWKEDLNPLMDDPHPMLGESMFDVKEGVTINGKSLDDLLEIEGHINAFKYIVDVVKDKQQFNEYHLASVNSWLYPHRRYTEKYDKSGNAVRTMVTGCSRTEENDVTQPDGSERAYPPHHLISDQMEDLCRWISKKSSEVHPICVGAIAYYNHLRIQPYQCGNGRGARFLLNMILLKHGYTPVIIEARQRSEYLTTLRAADKGNLLPFTLFVADSLQKTQTLCLTLDEIAQYHSLESPAAKKC